MNSVKNVKIISDFLQCDLKIKENCLTWKKKTFNENKTRFKGSYYRLVIKNILRNLWKNSIFPRSLVISWFLLTLSQPLQREKVFLFSPPSKIIWQTSISRNPPNQREEKGLKQLLKIQRFVLKQISSWDFITTLRNNFQRNEFIIGLKTEARRKTFQDC